MSTGRRLAVVVGLCRVRRPVRCRTRTAPLLQINVFNNVSAGATRMPSALT